MSLPKVLQKLINNVGYGQALTGNDNDIVHKTGDESIGGYKIFSPQSTILKNPDISFGTVPEEVRRIEAFFESNEFTQTTLSGDIGVSRLGELQYAIESDGKYHLELTLRKFESNSNIGWDLGLEYDPVNSVAYAYCPSTPSERDNANDILTRDWIPRDARIVHTTGNETISGLKIFNEYVEVHRVNTSFIAINPEIIFGQNPLADKANILRFITSDNHDYGGFQSIYRQNGETLTRISSERPDGGEASLLEVNNPATGAPYAWCPSTPDPTPANLNGRTFNQSGDRDILTRDWIPRDTRIVHTTGNESISGKKTFSTTIVCTDGGLISGTMGSNVAIEDTSRSSETNVRFGSIYDKNGSLFGGLEAEARTDGSNVVEFTMRNKANTGYVTDLELTVINDGSRFIKLNSPIVRSGTVIYNRVQNASVAIHNGTGASDGGGIWCYGKTSSNAGLVRLQAYNTAYRQLDCQSDGTLKWNGQVIQTSSDERLKTSMTFVPDEILDAWEDVQWGQFQFLDAVKEKGNSARFHIGLIAQAVDRVFNSRNVDFLRYGILCHDVQSESDSSPASETWMIRYTEALCMEAAYNRRRVSRLEEKIKLLEQKLNLAS